MSTFFKDNLLMFLPEEFAIRDLDTITLGPDGEERGDLGTLLEVVAISLDEFDNFAEQFTSIFDVDTCDEKYLPYLAKMVNYPLSDRDDVESKRLQIKNAVEWYKRKGLHEGFRILFYSLGYVINLVELWTRDYKSFHRYPGLWTPPIYNPRIIGTNLVAMTINEGNKNLKVSFDGGIEIAVQLENGNMRLLSSIAAEIDSKISPHGSCQIIDNKITLISPTAGIGGSVKIIDVVASAYTILGFKVKTVYGVNFTVPDDYYELQENGGSWYKSPHFGIEVYSIKGFVTDPEEFSYIRSRIELIRPIHTVLDWILYAKELAEVFEIEESGIFGQIQPNLAEQWPFPICMDRGSVNEFTYIRDGLVPDRRDSTRLFYKHKRRSLNNCPTRSSYEYTYFNLSREFPTGPPQMSSRGEGYYYRDGFPFGEPRRSSCQIETEELTTDLVYNRSDIWCTNVLRRGGLIHRDQPLGYLRDGSFTQITWRGQSEFIRSGNHDGFTRSMCKPPMEVQNGFMMFRRTDLPDVWFPSLSSLSDPNAIGITDQLPGPGESGPGL